MTNTDRAFIAAYQQSTIPLAAAETETTTTPASGPHFLWKNSAEGINVPSGRKSAAIKKTRRAPLSKLIAERHQRQASSEATFFATPPTLELNAFNWPDTPTRLAREYGSALIAALASIQGNIVTLVGASSGVGLTTMAIALAQATIRADLKVALVDANPVASDLAFQIGVRRLRTLAEAAEQGDTLEGCIVTCRDDFISLAIAGRPIDPIAARQSLTQLATSNDLVIVDAGAITLPLSPWITAAEGICLVDQPDQNRDDLLRSFSMAEIKVHGVLENFVSA